MNGPIPERRGNTIDFEKSVLLYCLVIQLYETPDFSPGKSQIFINGPFGFKKVAGPGEKRAGTESLLSLYPVADPTLFS